jgi:hypothetical protein
MIKDPGVSTMITTIPVPILADTPAGLINFMGCDWGAQLKVQPLRRCRAQGGQSCRNRLVHHSVCLP